MKSSGRRFLLLLFFVAFACRIGSAEPVRDPWIVSGGFGFTVSPTLALFTPQVEYFTKPDLLMGPVVQMGLGAATLFTVSWGVRYLSNIKKKFRPTLQGALGVAFGGGGSFPLGAHLMIGGGFDYQLDKKVSVGSMLNINFAPPLQTVFLSWPLLVARFLL